MGNDDEVGTPSQIGALAVPATGAVVRGRPGGPAWRLLDGAGVDGDIASQCKLRPSEEYRERTQQAWEEFVEHFGQRKIALGSCRRSYGADCFHRHAWIPCDFLQIDPGQAGRLAVISANLQTQVGEAEPRAMIRTCGWFPAWWRGKTYLPGDDLKSKQL